MTVLLVLAGATLVLGGFLALLVAFGVVLLDLLGDVCARPGASQAGRSLP